MIKSILIGALALFGAASATAQSNNGTPVLAVNKVVLIWGDSLAGGYMGDSLPAPTSPSLSGVGQFFGATGNPSDNRPRAWAPHTYTQGLPLPNPNVEFGSGIAFMGKRFTDNEVFVINLGLTGTDVTTNLYTDSRWVLDANGDLSATSQVRLDIRDAVVGLAAAGITDVPQFEISGIVFSCWNNGAAVALANQPAPGDPLNDVAALDGAKGMCDAIEAAFRQEFDAAYATSGQFTLSAAAPTRVAYRRHEITNPVFLGGREIQNPDLCDQWVDPTIAYGIAVNGDDVLAPLNVSNTPINEDVLQTDGVHLVPAATNLVGQTIGLSLFL